MALPPAFPPETAPVAGPGEDVPDERRPAPRRALWFGALTAMVGAVGVWGVWRFFVGSRTGRLMDHAALEGAGFGRNTLWDGAQNVLDVISVPFLVVVLLSTMLLAVLRRRVVLAVQVALLVGGANLTTQVLKKVVLERPELGTSDLLLNSLPSGHTTAAASVAAALVLVVPRRLRPAAAVVGVVYTVATGMSTLVAGWHRPSDVTAAVLVVLTWSGVATMVGALYEVPRSAPSGSRVGAAVTTVLLLGALAAGAGAGVALYRDLPRAESGLDSTADLLTAYGGGALGVVAVSCATFAALLFLRHLLDPRDT